MVRGADEHRLAAQGDTRLTVGEDRFAHREGLGVVVPAEDVAALTAAIERVLYDAEFAATALIAAADGIQIQWMSDRSIDMGAHVRAVWAALLA